MKFRDFSHATTLITLAATALGCKRQDPHSHNQMSAAEIKTYSVTGLVTEINANAKSVVIAHEAVPNYMPAMTMPFDIRDTNLFATLNVSQKIAFRLNVSTDQSWIDEIQPLAPPTRNLQPQSAPTAVEQESDETAAMTFTNEFGQPVKMTDFNGQALALNFFFTRCPLPNACPRQSQNFSEASQKLLAAPNIPSNWHFLSFTFDPKFDTPEVLKQYAKRYHYDSNHWTFLTGPEQRVKHLAQMFGFDYKPDAGIFSHSFRTVIIDPQQKVQQIYPITGDLSDAIYRDMVKALNGTNNGK